MRIFSYRKLWKHEKKLYSIQNFRLPFPVSLNDILFFFMGIAISALLQKVIPGYKSVPGIARYIIFPGLFLKFMSTVKLDGKNPVMYAFGCIVFLITEKGRCIEKFKVTEVQQKEIKINWVTSEGSLDYTKMLGRPIRLNWKTSRGGKQNVSVSD